MTPGNADLVRRGLKDVEFFWSLLDDDAVWDLGDLGWLDLDRMYVGREAIIDASRRFWETWEDYEIDAEELIELGARVAIAVYERGAGRGSGVPFERRFAQVWTFERGKIVRWDCFSDMPTALEAVGMSE